MTNNYQDLADAIDTEESRKTDIYRVPDWGYVSRTLMQLRWELQGAHTKIDEVERLKYFEDQNTLTEDEIKTGQWVQIGLISELLENIKAAILANTPKVRVKGLRKKNGVEENNSKREHHLQAKLDSMLYPVNFLSELVDSQLLGIAILKTGVVLSKWKARERRRKKDEEDEEFLDRVTALKTLWGPPVQDVVVHPLAAYFRPGEGSVPEEIIEQSYIPKRKFLKEYNDQGTHKGDHLTSIDAAAVEGGQYSLTPGQPTEFVRSLPSGIDTSDYCLVTQYWNPECYQVYINGELVHCDVGKDVRLHYFIAPGRSSSSKDPDKLMLSAAENLRTMEPVLNRMASRMVEALEKVVNKRNTLEVPDTFIPEFEDDGRGGSKPRTWTFTDEFSEALPPGAKIKDPFEGAEAAFQALPLFQLLLQIAGQHGVSPLFKGISPGAAGSGYRDNSLYLMAKAQFQYIIASLQSMLQDYLKYYEYLIVHHIKQEVYAGDWALKPEDITSWPAQIIVELKPSLPQNRIAEGEFGESQRASGNISRRRQREEFLGIEQPDEEEYEVDLEQFKDLMKPYIMMDVLKDTLGMGQEPGQSSSGLVDAQGNPISSQNANPSATLNGNTATGQSLNGRAQQQLAGFSTGGQGKGPVNEPAEFPPRNGENR